MDNARESVDADEAPVEPWGGDQNLRRLLMAERYGANVERERPATPDQRRRRKS